MDTLLEYPPFLQINWDIFHQIAKEILVEDTLSSLSLTCKTVRMLCLPIMFRDCVISATLPIKVSFLPDSLWLYVRSLTLVDRCPDIGAMQWHGKNLLTVQPYLLCTRDMLLCGIYDSAFLGNALRKMPQLHTVTLKLYPYFGFGHGLSWPLLRAILTVPHLREFRCDSHLFSPRPVLAAEDLSLPSPPPLTSFRYVLEDNRVPPRTYPSEHDAVDLVLRTFHTSLETLELPTEPTPFHTLRSLRWPLLRELILRGEFSGLDDPSIPLVSAFSRITSLHTLELALTPLPGACIRSIWPPGFITTYPWPNLRRLVTSFPRLDDQLYLHLPPTLRSLVLRYSPHLATYRWCHDWFPWTYPVVPARDMLRILRRCQIPGLEELTVEYHQDCEEPELLHYIATAFPRVRALKILRYREKDVEEVDIAGLARILATHPRLHTLSIYLDLPKMSYIRRYISTTTRLHGYRGVDERDYQELLDDAAEVLAQNLGTSVALIQQLRPISHTREWAVYRVIRNAAGDGDGNEPPHARYDHFLTCGMEQPTIVEVKLSDVAPSNKCWGDDLPATPPWEVTSEMPEPLDI